MSLFLVAAGTVCLGLECALAVVAFTAELAGINSVHLDFDGPHLHLREHVFVVAFLAAHAGILVNFTGEGHRTHRALIKLQGSS